MNTVKILNDAELCAEGQGKGKITNLSFVIQTGITEKL